MTYGKSLKNKDFIWSMSVFKSKVKPQITAFGNSAQNFCNLIQTSFFSKILFLSWWGFLRAQTLL